MTPAFGTLRICEDAADLARTGAAYLCDLAAERDGRTIVALSGGNTPKPLYELLAQEPFRSHLPWDRVHWILGDERFVPPSDPAAITAWPARPSLTTCLCRRRTCIP